MRFSLQAERKGDRALLPKTLKPYFGSLSSLSVELKKKKIYLPKPRKKALLTFKFFSVSLGHLLDVFSPHSISVKPEKQALSPFLSG